MADEFVVVCKASEIEMGSFKAAEVGGKRLLICHAAGGFHAIDDTCSHDDGPLADGFLDGTALECPRHGARFDVRTGKSLCLPAVIDIASYPVMVEGDEVKVRVGK